MRYRAPFQGDHMRDAVDIREARVIVIKKKKH